MASDAERNTDALAMSSSTFRAAAATGTDSAGSFTAVSSRHRLGDEVARSELSMRARQWDERLVELRAFREQCGHLHIPKDSLDPRLRGLGMWLARQRRLAASGQLPEDRQRALWEVDRHWRGRCAHPDDEDATMLGEVLLRMNSGAALLTWVHAQLARYQSLHGHVNVPRTSEEFPELARWCIRQRRLYRQKWLNPDIKDKLQVRACGVQAFERAHNPVCVCVCVWVGGWLGVWVSE
jgi:hypothetical protein